jgi:predicted ATPase
MEQREDSQMIMVTHSPILMSYPNADIFLFSQNGIQPCAVEDVENYQLMKRFFQNPQEMIRETLNGRESDV